MLARRPVRGRALAIVRALAAVLVSALAACGAPPAAIPSPEQVRVAAETATLASEVIDGEWAPGVSIALITPDGVQFFGFGRTSPTDAEAPGPDTDFEIASVSKVFTGLLLAIAAIQGELKLDDPLQRHLPKLRVPRFDHLDITLEHLATHTSGLPRLPSDFAPSNPADPYADLTLAGLSKSLTAVEIKTRPGSRYAYSNLGAGLLGHALALRLNQSYGELLRTRITLAIDMPSTGLKPLAKRIAAGYTDTMPTSAWHFGALQGAGAVHSTTRDLARFVQAFLGQFDTDLTAPMKLALEPRRRAGKGQIALGWHISPSGVYWHNGQSGGFHSFVAMDRKRGLGVVVLANGATPMIDPLGNVLLLMLRGDPYRFQLARPTQVDPASLSRFVGHYAVEAGVEVEVVEEAGHLYARPPGMPKARLYATGPADFSLRVAKLKFRFVTDEPDAPAQRVVLVENGKEQVAERVR